MLLESADDSNATACDHNEFTWETRVSDRSCKLCIMSVEYLYHAERLSGPHVK